MSTFVDELRRQYPFDDKPLAGLDGSASPDHRYHLFANGWRVVTFAVPSFTDTGRSIDMALELLGPGWQHIEIDNADYAG